MAGKQRGRKRSAPIIHEASLGESTEQAEDKEPSADPPADVEPTAPDQDAAPAETPEANQVQLDDAPEANQGDQNSPLKGKLSRRAMWAVGTVIAFAIVSCVFVELALPASTSTHVLAAVVAPLAALCALVVWMLGWPSLRVFTLGTTWRENSAAFLKVLAGVLAIVVALVAVFGVLRTMETSANTQYTEQLNARYIEASNQLGDPSAAVRAAGVLALATVADDWLMRAKELSIKDHPCQDEAAGTLTLSSQASAACAQAKLAIQTIIFYLRSPIPLSNGEIPPRPSWSVAEDATPEGTVESEVTVSNMPSLNELDQNELSVRKAVADVLRSHFLGTCRLQEQVHDEGTEDEHNFQHSQIVEPGQWTNLALDFSQTFSGDLDLTETSAEPSALPFVCSVLSTGRGATLNFADLVIYGTASFEWAHIEGNTRFDRAFIGGEARFDNAHIGEYAQFNFAHIGGNARFDNAHIGGNAWFDNAHIGGNAQFDNAHIGEYAWFFFAHIGGDAWFNYAHIGGNARFFLAHIGGDARFFLAHIGGDARFNYAHIGGNARFERAHIGGNAWFDNAHIGAQWGPTTDSLKYVSFSKIELKDYEITQFDGTVQLIENRVASTELRNQTSYSGEDSSFFVGPGWTVEFDECTAVNDTDQPVRLSALPCI